MKDTDRYLVGGAVRDALLGRAVHERDWVVVGLTRDAMLAAGYRQVGRDFPVFLHPETHEEYALARTERKRGRGHVEFEIDASPDVTLEQDLARRDLTINALARAHDGRLIDPYGGERDLHARVLRHVSPAFVEDPLRVFRVARFAAQLAPFGFRVADETLELMRAMADSGELAALSAERVWAELVKALPHDPSLFFAVLRDAHALTPWFAEWQDTALPEPWPVAVDVEPAWHTASAFALVCSGLDLPACERASERLRVPRQCGELAGLLVRERSALAHWRARDDAAVLDLLRRCDALRREDRFAALVATAAALGAVDSPTLRELAHAVRAAPVNVRGAADPAAAVQAQRLQTVARWRADHGGTSRG